MLQQEGISTNKRKNRTKDINSSAYFLSLKNLWNLDTSYIPIIICKGTHVHKENIWSEGH